MHGGKFAFQSRLRYVACSGKEINLPCLLCFTLYSRANSRANSKYKPPGGLYSEGRFNGGFLRYDFGGPIFGGAYKWRGLFSEFYGGQYQRIERMIELDLFPRF